MANTYTQIHIHLIFAVKFRQAQIHSSWKERLHQYLTGIIQSNKHKVLQIESMPDHIHILIGQRPEQALSTLIQNTKSERFGAFSYSKSQIPRVINYIQKQEEHHKKKSFLEEYRSILDAFGLEWDEKYIFHDLL